MLLRGYVFSGDEALKTAAQMCVDHHLGANPLAYSWLTGAGHYYPKHICQHPTEFDGIDEPVPGIPIIGPRWMSPQPGKGGTHGRLFAQKLFPAADRYPYLRFYSELPRIPGISEFVTTSQSNCVFAYSFFAPERE